MIFIQSMILRYYGDFFNLGKFDSINLMIQLSDLIKPRHFNVFLVNFNIVFIRLML
jgi:hypothetical protein